MTFHSVKDDEVQLHFLKGTESTRALLVAASKQISRRKSSPGRFQNVGFAGLGSTSF